MRNCKIIQQNIFTTRIPCVRMGDMAVMKMSIGENIKSIRKEQKITQKKLHELTGLAIITIQEYEADKYKPRPDSVAKIAYALKVSPRQIDPEFDWIYKIQSGSLGKYPIYQSLPVYDEEDINVFRQFLSLNPDGKQKASEYIEFLMQKQEK